MDENKVIFIKYILSFAVWYICAQVIRLISTEIFE
jgi:hypothetical protein